MMISGILPANAKGFTFGSKHSGKDLDMWLLRSPIPLLPSTEDFFGNVIGRDGVYDFGSKSKALRFNLECAIKSSSEEELVTKMEDIASWLNPKQGVQQLIFDRASHKYYNARYSGEALVTEQARQGFVRIPFICPDPYAYAIEDEVLNVSSAGSHTFTRLKGNANSWPLIEVDGLNTYGTLTISTNGRELQWGGVLNEGDKLYFDCANLTCYYNSPDNPSNNAFTGLRKYAFPYLLAGENIIDIQTTGDFTITQISINGRSRWLI